MASITITGNVVRDPEVRSTPSGQSVTSFSLAENRRYQDRTSQAWAEVTSFFDVSVWGDLGENVAYTLKQGDRATVTGRIEQRTWETPEGEKRSKLEVTATDVAASLRFATADIARVERKGPDEDES